MDDTFVPNTTQDVAAVQAELIRALPDLTPELRKAAAWVLEHPGEISVSSVRLIADRADVKPNTLVRMARAIGYDGFDDLRQPFREEIRTGRDSFPDRARWLQERGQGGELGALYAQMADAALGNIQELYAQTDPSILKAAADAIVSARRAYILGVGVANPPARNFAYLAGMALDTITAIPTAGSLPADDLARADGRDVLIAMTFKPYRREVVEAVELAVAQGIRVIAISDSLASPIQAQAECRFVVPTETPQAFTSTIALSAFLELLMAFVIADADSQVVEHLEHFHDRRHRLGIYWEEPRR